MSQCFMQKFSYGLVNVLATALMLGKSPLDSATFAAPVAAISVTRIGAQPSMPSMAEVEEFMENESPRVA